MKHFIYLFIIFLASTASFAGKNGKQDSEKSDESKILKRAFSMSALRFKREEEKRKEGEKSSVNNNNSKDITIRPRSRTSVAPLSSEEGLTESKKNKSSSDKDEDENELPPLEDLFDSKAGRFNLVKIARRQRMVRKDQLKYGSINTEPTVDLVNFKHALERYPFLARLTWEEQQEVAKLASGKGGLQETIYNLNQRLKEGEEKGTGTPPKKQINFFEKEIERIDTKLKSLFKEKVDFSKDLSFEQICAHVLSFVNVKEKILKNFSSYGVTIEHLDPYNKAWRTLRSFAEMEILQIKMSPEMRTQYLKELEETYENFTPLEPSQEATEPKREND